MTASAAASLKSSAVSPLLAGAIASGNVLEGTGITTGTAVLIILGGGAFLLSIVVNVMKLRCYSKSDRKTEAKAEAAELASRHELDKEITKLWDALTHAKEQWSGELGKMTSLIGGIHADMQNAIGRLQGLAAAQHKKS